MLKRLKNLKVEKIESIGKRTYYTIYDKSRKRRYEVVAEASKFFVCDCMAFSIKGKCSHVEFVKRLENDDL